MKFLFPLSLSISASLFSASVGIFNDSPFKLNAQIISATGTYLGEVSINPQDYQKWDNPNVTDTASGSMTPFTVLFTCSDGEEYGISTIVPAGGTITAQGSQGRKFCRVQKPNQQDGSPGPRQLPSSDW